MHVWCMIELEVLAMHQEILDLYAEYLLTSFGRTTATGLAELLDNAVSHDRITR